MLVNVPLRNVKIRSNTIILFMIILRGKCLFVPTKLEQYNIRGTLHNLSHGRQFHT